MPVEHDEDLLLTITIDTSHSDVNIVIAVDEVHAWHVGSQDFLQVGGSAVMNHLFCDEGGRYWYLTKALCLTGRRRDSGY